MLIADTYDLNPTAFIAALSNQNDETTHIVIHLLTYEYSFRNIDKLQTHMRAIISDETSNHSSKIIATEILEYIEKIRTPIQIDPTIPVYSDTIRLFNSDVVRRIIDANLQIGTSDESFCSYLAKHYLANPKQFADMISDLPKDSISHLGQCIAYDFSKNKISIPSVEEFSTSTTLTALEASISENIRTSTPTANDITHNTTATSLTSTSFASGSVPNITNLTCSYDNSDYDEPLVGEYIYINVTIENTTSPSSLYVYYIELYEVDGSTEDRIDGSTLAIPPGSTNATYSFRKIFTSTGGKSFLVKVHTQGKGTLLNEKYYSCVITMYGLWSISIDLPSVRTNLGCLTVFDAGGTAMYRAICLGCSASGSDASVENGNTPTGVYRGALVGPDANTNSYGPYKVIHMVGLSGQIIEYSHRNDICIHGGQDGTVSASEPNYPLHKTNGCIRITSQFQGVLVDMIESWIDNSFYYARGTITIEEINAQTVNHPTTDPWYETV